MKKWRSYTSPERPAPQKRYRVPWWMLFRVAVVFLLIWAILERHTIRSWIDGRTFTIWKATPEQQAYDDLRQRNPIEPEPVPLESLPAPAADPLGLDDFPRIQIMNVPPGLKRIETPDGAVVTLPPIDMLSPRDYPR